MNSINGGRSDKDMFSKKWGSSGNIAVQDMFSERRYQELWQYFHLPKGTHSSESRFDAIAYLDNHLKARFHELYVPYPDVAIDELRFRFAGKFRFKTVERKKPI